MTHYALTMQDGSIEITQTFNGANIDDCIAKWPKERTAKIVSVTPIDPASIPKDRTHRSKWAIQGNKIIIDHNR